MDFSFLSDAQVEAELGRRVRRRRVEVGLNQGELAERAGLSRRTVSSVENGEGGSMGTLVALLRALGALDDLDAVLPDPGVSPIALTESAVVKERKYPYKPRGKGKKEGKAGGEGAGEWKWGDERDGESSGAPEEDGPE